MDDTWSHSFFQDLRTGGTVGLAWLGSYPWGLGLGVPKDLVWCPWDRPLVVGGGDGEVVFCGLDVVVAVFFLVPVGTCLYKTRRCFFCEWAFFLHQRFVWFFVHLFDKPEGLHESQVQLMTYIYVYIYIVASQEKNAVCSGGLTMVSGGWVGCLPRTPPTSTSRMPQCWMIR